MNVLTLQLYLKAQTSKYRETVGKQLLKFRKRPFPEYIPNSLRLIL